MTLRWRRVYRNTSHASLSGLLVGLGLLLFLHAGKDAVDTWALYAGSVTAIYTTAKSLKPNDAPKPAPGVEITRTETAEGGSDVLK